MAPVFNERQTESLSDLRGPNSARLIYLFHLFLVTFLFGLEGDQTLECGGLAPPWSIVGKKRDKLEPISRRDSTTKAPPGALQGGAPKVRGRGKTQRSLRR